MLRRRTSRQPGSTSQEMLRRTSRKKTLMRKMSDIVLKELQSESDEDFEPPNKTKGSPSRAPPKKHPMVSAQGVVTQNLRQDMNQGPCHIRLSPHTIGSGDVDFTLTDTEDDVKSFDLSSSPTQPLLTSSSAIDNAAVENSPIENPPVENSPVDNSAVDNSPEIILGDTTTHKDVESNAGKEKIKRRNGKITSKLSTEYYRQLYRPAWEQMAEFKGWLNSVPGVPTKARCLFCSVELSAHHVSLLKHVASAKHQRNAERMFILNLGTAVNTTESCRKTSNNPSLPSSQSLSKESVPPSSGSQSISNPSSYNIATTRTPNPSSYNIETTRSQASLLSAQDTAEEDMDDLFDKVHIILADDCVADDQDKEDIVTLTKDHTVLNDNDHTILNDNHTVLSDNHTVLNDNDHNILSDNHTVLNNHAVLNDNHTVLNHNHTVLNDHHTVLNKHTVLNHNITVLSDNHTILSEHTVLNNKQTRALSDKDEETMNEKELSEALSDKEMVVTLEDLDEEFSEEEENSLVQIVKVPRESIVLASCTGSDRFQPISTHVIDSHAGLPISNLEVTLYKLVNGAWRLVSELTTNGGGRATDFIADMDQFQCGRYKLHYHLFKYFELKRVSSIFPFIEVPFDVRRKSDHLHFPLIVSANGFHVYKGCAL